MPLPRSGDPSPGQPTQVGARENVRGRTRSESASPNSALAGGTLPATRLSRAPTSTMDVVRKRAMAAHYIATTDANTSAISGYRGDSKMPRRRCSPTGQYLRPMWAWEHQLPEPRVTLADESKPTRVDESARSEATHVHAARQVARVPLNEVLSGPERPIRKHRHSPAAYRVDLQHNMR